MIELFFKSIIDSDCAPIVVCDLKHKIVYMNPEAAKRYKKHGGYELVGKSLLDCHNEASNKKIRQVTEWFKADKNNNRVFTFHSEKENKDVYMIALRNESGELLGYYEKHEYRTAENAQLYDLK